MGFSITCRNFWWRNKLSLKQQLSNYSGLVVRELRVDFPTAFFNLVIGCAWENASCFYLMKTYCRETGGKEEINIKLCISFLLDFFLLMSRHKNITRAALSHSSSTWFIHQYIPSKGYVPVQEANNSIGEGCIACRIEVKPSGKICVPSIYLYHLHHALRGCGRMVKKLCRLYTGEEPCMCIITRIWCRHEEMGGVLTFFDGKSPAKKNKK